MSIDMIKVFKTVIAALVMFLATNSAFLIAFSIAFHDVLALPRP